MGRLKEVRTEKKLTQQQVADLFGISLRSYKSYENDPVKEGSLKYHYMLEKLAELASDTSAPKSSARSAPEL